MIKNENIIYFSSDEWNSGLTTSQYHMAVRLARQNRVLYVNSIGLRRPKATKGDALRILRKLKMWFAGVHNARENLFVITPIVLPFHNIAAVRAINRLLLIIYIRRVQRERGLNAPILWTFLPNVADILGSFGEKKVVYYCADQVSSFRGVDPAAIAEMEKKLLARADFVFATSRSLYEEKLPLNRHTCYMPHGVDVELFNTALADLTAVPADIAAFRKPVIGYFGLISADWIDFSLLEHLAEAHPEWSIALIGKYSEEARSLIRKTNIHLMGPRPYGELPGYCKAFDVAIIPFVVSELTRNSNPLKMKEYLAAGRPVVSTRIPELEQHARMIRIAGSHDDFLRAVENTLSADAAEEKTRRARYVGGESWEGKFREISAMVSG